MSNLDFYIRFGVHKEREILNEMKGYISGLCIPCHILSYTQDPTIAAIKYVEKPYFIDPMTYIYATHDFPKYLAKKESEDGKKQIKFKPSIQKLTIDLNLVDHFESNSYTPLTPATFTDDFTNSLAKSSVDLQLSKANNGKESAYKRYSALLNIAEGKEMNDQISADISPKFVVSPYFYFKNALDPWFQVNIRLYNSAKVQAEGFNTVPFIMTDTEALTKSLIDSYDSEVILLWLTDFDPKSASGADKQIEKLTKLKEFIEYAASENKKIIDVYGSYYSIVLAKTGGMAGICNGVLHGESKSKDATIGGGAPPVRYYVRKLHSFLSVLNATSVLRSPEGQSLLDTECKECVSLIDNEVANLDRFEDNPYLAQKHFIHARICEIDFVENHELEDIVSDMESHASSFNTNFGVTIGTDIYSAISNWVRVLTKK